MHVARSRLSSFAKFCSGASFFSDFFSGAPLAGESKAKFELLLQKVAALDLDAVIARLVKKKDYMPKIAKRAADEYRKFLVLMGMGETPVAPKMVVDAWQAHIMPPVLTMWAY